MLQLVKEPTNVAPLGALTRFLENSLEPRAYELFLEEIGILVIEIFYEDSVEDADGFPDDVKTKELHYRKYCLFKFASFLDLLCPDSVHWRGQAELEREPLIRTGLDRFQSAGPQARASDALPFDQAAWALCILREESGEVAESNGATGLLTQAG